MVPGAGDKSAGGGQSPHGGESAGGGECMLTGCDWRQQNVNIFVGYTRRFTESIAHRIMLAGRWSPCHWMTKSS